MSFRVFFLPVSDILCAAIIPFIVYFIHHKPIKALQALFGLSVHPFTQCSDLFTHYFRQQNLLRRKNGISQAFVLTRQVDGFCTCNTKCVRSCSIITSVSSSSIHSLLIWLLGKLLFRNIYMYYLSHVWYSNWHVSLLLVGYIAIISLFLLKAILQHIPGVVMCFNTCWHNRCVGGSLEFS